VFARGRPGEQPVHHTGGRRGGQHRAQHSGDERLGVGGETSLVKEEDPLGDGAERSGDVDHDAAGTRQREHVRARALGQSDAIGRHRFEIAVFTTVSTLGRANAIRPGVVTFRITSWAVAGENVTFRIARPAIGIRRPDGSPMSPSTYRTVRRAGTGPVN
jgi:hypothetical protein